MTLLAIFGCAPGTRDLPALLNGLIIDAAIEQSTERHGAGGEGYVSDHVHVVLQDRAGRTIEREDLQVAMNDTRLNMRGAHGSFYERHPFYRLDDASAHLAADSECRFTLVRPDGSFHDAGVVRTPKALTPAQFEFPESISRGEMLKIEWSDLAEPAELVVFRSHSYTDPTGSTVVVDGISNDPETHRRIIGPGLLRRASGRLEIPAAYLADHDGRHVGGIGVEISVAHFGAAPDGFSKESLIRATRRLVFHAELAD